MTGTYPLSEGCNLCDHLVLKIFVSKQMITLVNPLLVFSIRGGVCVWGGGGGGSSMSYLLPSFI